MKRKFLKAGSTRNITFIYFFLLLYIISALVWWGILLHRQNKEISGLKLEKLELQRKGLFTEELYEKKKELITEQNKIRNLQYMGEGGAFLLIILLSAAYIFRSTRRQINFSIQQQNFMMAVTHELKSPIAVVRLNIETLLKRSLPKNKHDDLLMKSLAETNRLNRLSNNMLLASQFENRQYHLNKEEIDFSQLVKKMVDELQWRTKGHYFATDIQPDIYVRGDVLMLQIVCSNLLENAQKYSPSNSPIQISVREKKEQAILQIIDEGEGVPEEEKNKIFSRFYRVGNENTRKSKGTGLGLFLTAKIVDQHNGKIRVMDNYPKGSTFEVALPKMEG